MLKMTKMLPVLAVLLLWTTPAQATGAFDIGLGVGCALPSGDMVRELPLAEQASGALAVHIDALYRYTHRIRFGLTGSYGLVGAGSAIATVHAASQYRMALGVTGEYHWAPFASQDPWVSAAVSWSQFTQQVTTEDLGKFVKDETVWQAPLGGEVRAGYQFSFSPGLYIGPYVSATFESYNSYKNTTTVGGTSATATVSVPSDDQTWHAWFGLGVTGRYGL